MIFQQNWVLRGKRCPTANLFSMVFFLSILDLCLPFACLGHGDGLIFRSSIGSPRLTITGYVYNRMPIPSPMHRFIARGFLSIPLVILTIFGFVSCAPTPPPPPPLAEQVLYFWNDDGGPGEISIRIHLNSQIATVWRGRREVGWCYVATGRAGHGTPVGTFRVSEMKRDKVSNRWGWQEDASGEVINPSVKYDKPVPRGAKFVFAPMPYWMRLTDYGIGMHGGYIPNPGMPASAGCIRLPQDFAPMLFEVVKLGTPVTIAR